jgi:ABC-type glycerol-3-phosphate transport system substrate-binding protein
MRRFARRRMLLGLGSAGLAAVGASVLGACGATPAPVAVEATSAPVGTAAATSAPAKSGEKITIEMMVDFEPDYIEYCQKTLDPRFAEMYSGATVEIVPLDWNRLEEQLLTSKAAGAMPDIFRMGATFVPIAADNELSLTLDERLSEWGQADDFYPAALSNCQWRGKTWGLPQLTSPRHYCYRKDLTDEAGVTISDEWTWDDMMDAAIKLTVREGDKMVRMGSSCYMDMQEYWGVLSAGGGQFILDGKPAFNSEAGLWALNWIKERNNSIAPEGTAPLAESPIPYFSTGQWVIAYGHPGNHWINVRKYAPEHIDDVVVPQPPLQSRRVCKMNTDWLAIAVTTKYADAAWEYMKLQMDPAALAAFNESFGFLPPRKSSLEAAEYMKSDVMTKVGENMATFGEPFRIIPVWQKFDLIIKPMIEAAVLGQKTPEQALAEAEKEANEIMADYPDWPNGAGG